MSTGKDNVAIGKLEKKVDKLATEMDSLSETLKILTSLPALTKQIGTISSDIKDMKTEVSPIAKIDELFKSIKGIDSTLVKVSDSKNMTDFGKKVEDLINQVKGIDSSLKDYGESVKMDSFEKQINDVLSAVTGIGTTLKQVRDADNTELLGKKIDDMQQYIAGLSTIEDKVQEMSDSFSETKEIVGIIVRQLDDIERKYNTAIGDVSKAMDLVRQAIESGASIASLEESESKKPAKGKKSSTADKPTTPFDGESPSNVDELMDTLIALVHSQTEAKEMAQALETVRDNLTTMIQGHTPVLFQFGKRARELKTYPPTATLNENDIARLNKEIRDWKTKLLKIADE
ncbi:MAG: hypothetical protein ACTSU3_01005 [Candidatus Thorarchaeota archaeon]